MSSLIDTNVFIDVLGNAGDRDWSVKALRDAHASGPIVVNPVVWSELATPSLPESRLVALLAWLSPKRETLSFEATYQAGLAHRRYRQAGGQRERTLPDFLIGAHALTRGHALVTRDPSRYRSYFPDLTMIAPDTHP